MKVQWKKKIKACISKETGSNLNSSSFYTLGLIRPVLFFFQTPAVNTMNQSLSAHHCSISCLRLS